LDAAASLGCVGVGTRNPKYGTLVSNDARRMKCSVFVLSSQMINALSVAIRTSVPLEETGAQALAGTARRIPASQR
jgi:hypothetical protein